MSNPPRLPRINLGLTSHQNTKYRRFPRKSFPFVCQKRGYKMWAKLHSGLLVASLNAIIQWQHNWIRRIIYSLLLLLLGRQ